MASTAQHALAGGLVSSVTGAYSPGTTAWPIGRPVALGEGEATWVLESDAPPGAPTLLLLHGLGSTAALNWSGTFAALGRRFHLIAPDHCGHGRGRRPRGRFRLADCADDAAALLDALDVERVVAVGYSMGGPIAQLLWHRHPERVAGLVLCATSRNFRGRRKAALRDVLLSRVVAPGIARGAALLPAMIRRLFAGQLLRFGIGPELRERALAEVERHAPRAVVEAASAVARFDSAPWAPTIDVPTAVVLMERDGLVSPRAQRKLADSIPGTTIHRVDAGHDACVSHPREFAASLERACQSVIRRGSTRSARRARRGA